MHTATLIGIDGATGFALLEVATLKSGPPQIALADTLNTGAKVEILSTDIQMQVQNTSQGPRTIVLPSIKIEQGSIGQSSSYAKARGALTVYSGHLLSRNDSSVVITPEKQVAGIAQYAGYGRAYLFTISYLRDTIAQRVIQHKGFVPAGWLGASGDSLAQLTDDEFNQIGLTSRAGVVVRQVVPGSAAAACGMQAGDVILSVDGFNIANAADLIALLSMSPEGRKVTIHAFRNRQSIEFTAALGARPNSQWNNQLSIYEQQLEPLDIQRAQLEKRLEELRQPYLRYRELARQPNASREAIEAYTELDMEIRNINASLATINTAIHEPTPPKAGLSNEIIGGDLVASPMPDQLATFFKVKGGVLVKRVAAGSMAERIGLKAGDVIISAQAEPVASVDQLIELLNSNSASITLQVVRKDQPQPLNVTFTNH